MHRKPRLWHLGAGFLFLAACFAPSVLNASNDPWDAGLERYQLQLQRDSDFMTQSIGMFDAYCNGLTGQFDAARANAEVMYFMMLQRDRYEALAVTFYSDRIAGLINECEVKLARFEALRRRLAEIQRVYDEMSAGLAQFNLQHLSNSQHELLTRDTIETKQFSTRFHQFETRAAEVSKRLVDDLNRIREIAAVSDTRQSEVIRTIFFDNESNFMQVLPRAGMLVRYWVLDSCDTLTIQLENFEGNLLWRFPAYAVWISLMLTGIGYLVYSCLLEKFLKLKMPDLFQRRRQIQRNFLILAVGLGIYWSDLLIVEIDMQMFRQFAVGLILLACLRLALVLRLNREQQKIALPVYYATVGTYFVGMLLSVGMISYMPLIILSTLLSSLAAFGTLISLRRFRRLELMERIFGVVTTLNFAIAAMLGFLGFAYMSLTMMLAWFVVSALFQAIFTLSTVIREFVAVDSRYPVFNQVLSHFLIPAAWLWLMLYLFGWVAQTYHVEARLYALLDSDLVQRANLAQFNAREVFLVIFVGIGLYFLISAIRLAVKGVFGDSAEFGLLPSFMILSNYVLWGLFLIFALAVFKVQYSSILVVIGGMSMGLGFGLKEIVENFIAGLILLIGQQVRPGDIVEIKGDGIIGKVLQVSVRATVVETFDGAVITYPNAQVLTKEFQNWTSNNMLRRNTLSVGVSYGTDLSLAMKLIFEAAQSTAGVTARPAPEILCTDFGSSSVDFSLRYWANVNTSVLVGSNLRREIYRSFAEHGIGIPFPQLDVHIQPESGKLLSQDSNAD